MYERLKGYEEDLQQNRLYRIYVIGLSGTFHAVAFPGLKVPFVKQQ
jgi:hypothetical protein